MKIAIDGTHSTGKTTLLNALKINNYNDYEYIQEIGSVVAKEHFFIESQSDFGSLFKNKEKYGLFIKILMEEQISKELTHEKFVVDSSLYRACAYAIQNGIPISDSVIKKIKYDMIFYCPIEFSYIDDGFRFDFCREEVDRKLVEIINKYHNGRLIILKGSIENRILTIKRYI